MVIPTLFNRTNYALIYVYSETLATKSIKVGIFIIAQLKIVFFLFFILIFFLSNMTETETVFIKWNFFLP